MCVRQLDLEEQKRARWQAENVRRKHNYVPFIINLLRSVSKLLSNRTQWKGYTAARETREVSYSYSVTVTTLHAYSR